MRSALALFLLFSLASNAQAERPETFEAFVEDHCRSCHGPRRPKAGLDLRSLAFDPSDPGNHARWVSVHDRVSRGEMPPADREAPEPGERKAFLELLTRELEAAEKKRFAASGRAQLRRLGRQEHIHALQDLFAMPTLDVGELLPPDSLSDGFGKSSVALPFSHVQVDRTLEVAGEALRAAMAPQREKPESTVRKVWLRDLRGKTWFQRRGQPAEQETSLLSQKSPFLYQAVKNGNGMPIVGREADRTYENWTGNFAKRAPGYVLDQKPYFTAVGVLHHGTQTAGQELRASHAGRYKLRVGAFAYRAKFGEVEPTDRTEIVAFYGNSRLLGTVNVTSELEVQEIEVWLEAREQIDVSAASLPFWRLETGEKGRRYLAVDTPAVAFTGFALEGPFIDTWPPASHRRLFGDLPLRPLEDENEKDGKRGQRRNTGRDGRLDYEVISEKPREDARRLLTSFIEAAYRREVRDSDLELPLEAFGRRLGNGDGFQEAMLSAYTAVLASPHFVLVPVEPGRLPPNELANRLALFLWSAPADEALRHQITREVADSPEKLRRVVDRMIEDPRCERFVDHFLDHWLDLRNLGVTEPDENLYLGFTPLLFHSMRMETRAFFLEMLREDLPARTVLTSDFLTINEPLADLYEIEGVKGAEIRRVRLPEKSRRGGLLTQASLLKVSANGTTTSPVVRGAFVLDRLLGDPPPPPPESVPAVEPDISGATTIREQLAKHREDPACQPCHQKIDPPGFALESFDVMGRFRTRYPSLEKGDPVEGLNRRAKKIKFRWGLPVDSTGQLADGRPFEGIEDFREFILEDERQVARNLLERLVLVATGQAVSFSDRPEVERMLDQTKKDGYRLKSLIHELVESPLFRNK